MLNVNEIRGDFPILNKGVIYFDNAASSLTPEQVVLKEMERRWPGDPTVEQLYNAWQISLTEALEDEY